MMYKILLMTFCLIFSGCFTVCRDCDDFRNQSRDFGALHVEIINYWEFGMKKVIGTQLYVKNRWVWKNIEKSVNEEKFCKEFIAPSEIFKYNQCFVGERIFTDSTGKIAFECIAKMDYECVGSTLSMPKDSIVTSSTIHKALDDFEGFYSLDSLKMELPLESPKYKALKGI